MLVAACGLLLWSVAPALLGWQVTVVLTGSMEPAIRPGDVLIAQPVAPASLHPGQVALFTDPTHPGRLLAHRVVDVLPDSLLTTKGDANAVADSTPVAPADVHGLGRLLVPMIGLPVLWLRTGQWVQLLVLLGVTALVGMFAAWGGGQHRAGRRAVRDVPRPGNPLVRQLGRHRTTGVALGLVVAACLATQSPSADAAWVAQASSPGNSFSARSSWCTESYCRTALSRDPSFYWRLDEPSGSVAQDQTSNGRTGNYVGGVSRGADASLPNSTNAAVALDGSTGYLVRSESDTLTAPMTIQLRVRSPTSVGGPIVTFGNSQGATSSTVTTALYFAVNDGTATGRVYFGVQTATGGYVTVKSSISLADGGWHDLSASIAANGTLSLTSDGNTVTSSATAPASTTGYWRVGREALSGWPYAPSVSYLTGSVDEVRVQPN